MRTGLISVTQIGHDVEPWRRIPNRPTAQVNDALPLTAAQVRALEYVRTVAERERDGATDRAATVLARAGTNVEVGELCASVTALGRVALNFHPDRIAAGGRTVAEAMLADGVYRNQFETLISIGGLGAVREHSTE